MLKTDPDQKITSELNLGKNICSYFLHVVFIDNQLVSTGLLIMGNLVTSDHNVEQLVTEEVIATYFSLISSSVS